MESTPVSNPALPWLASYRALTTGCGVADLSNRSRVELTGADRIQFLHSFCTADIKRLVAGDGCEAFLTNHQGRTVGHVLVRVQANALLLDSAPGQAAAIIQHLNRFVISDRVEFRDLTAETAELLVAGDDAERVLNKVCGAALPGSFGQFALCSLAGKSVCVQRVDYAGSKSFVLTASAADLSAVMQTLESAGAVQCDPAAANAARLEGGVPLFGIDITDDNLPQEIGRDKQAISFTKGCYLGQETVARIDAMGHVNRLLVRVRFEAAEVPAPGLELAAGGKAVGKVTSATWSPRLASPLAFAMLRRTQATPGTKLESTLGTVEVIAPGAV